VVSPRHTLGAESEVGTSSQSEEEDTEEWFGLHDDSGSRDSSGPFPRTRSMLSYLAPPSPTVSAFHDALEGRRDSESSPAGADTDIGASSGPETFVTADTRASVHSPPPRQSTSIPPQPLPPPPRRRRDESWSPPSFNVEAGADHYMGTRAIFTSAALPEWVEGPDSRWIFPRA
jgi:hypothetical protein